MSVRDGVTMFLSRHDKLRYLLRCLKRVNNNEFVKDITNLHNKLLYRLVLKYKHIYKIIRKFAKKYKRYTV